MAAFNPNSRALWLGLAILALGAVVYLCTDGGTAQRLAPGPEEGSGREVAAHAQVTDRMEQQNRENSVSSPDDSIAEYIIFEAVSESGKCLQAAKILRSAGNQRLVASEQVLGVTDPRGRAAIATADLEGFGDDLLVGVHPLHLPVSIDRPNEGEPLGPVVTVRFTEGSCVRIICQDPDGLPLEGIDLFMSQASLPGLGSLDEIDALGAWYCADPVHGIHVLRTDQFGTAQKCCLQPGRYSVLFRSNTHERVERGRLIVDVPGPDGVAVMAPMYCAVLEPPARGLLYSKSSYKNQHDLVHISPGSANIRRLITELRSAYPGRLVYVTATRNGMAGDWPSLDLEARVLGHGRQQATILLTPVSAGCGPTPMFFGEELANASSSWQSVTVRILDVLGREIPLTGLCLDLSEESRGVRIPIRTGEPISLPEGSYPIIATTPFLEQAYETGFIEANEDPGAQTVRLSMNFRRCKIEFTGPGSESCGSGTLELVALGKRRIMQLSDAAELDCWLPVGPVEFSAQFFGFAPAIGTLEVQDGEPDEHMVLVVELALADTRR